MRAQRGVCFLAPPWRDRGADFREFAVPAGDPSNAAAHLIIKWTRHCQLGLCVCHVVHVQVKCVRHFYSYCNPVRVGMSGRVFPPSSYVGSSIGGPPLKLGHYRARCNHVPQGSIQA